MNNIQQERHLNGNVFDVIVKISKRKNREKPYNYYHWQDYHELIYVLDGESILVLEGKEYPLSPGALAYINPYELHMTTQVPDTRCRMLVVQFNIPERERKDYGLSGESMYLTSFQTLGNQRCPVVYPPFPGSDEISRIMDSILSEAQYQEEGWKTVLRGYVIVLLGLISRIAGTSPVRRSDSSVLDADEVCKYIEENCTNKLSLEAAAKRFQYAPVYFSKLFRQLTGQNFKDYVDYILMRKAQNYLLNEGRSMSETADLLEYSTPSSFARAYKRMIGKFHTVDPTIVKKVVKQ